MAASLLSITYVSRPSLWKNLLSPLYHHASRPSLWKNLSVSTLSSRQQYADATSLLVQRFEVRVGPREARGHDLDLRIQQRALDPLRGNRLHACRR